MPPTYYRGCWHVVSRDFLVGYRHYVNSYSHARSSPTTELYEPKPFFTHAALLHQAFAHCGRFPTAASRRSLGRVSVPMWPSTLSGRLRIIALVGRYPANWLIRRRSIHVHTRRSFNIAKMPCLYLSGFSRRFHLLSRVHGQVPYVLLTRSPLSLSKASFQQSSFDLHVLGMPPAFILSQDQTLHLI